MTVVWRSGIGFGSGCCHSACGWCRIPEAGSHQGLGTRLADAGRGPRYESGLQTVQLAGDPRRSGIQKGLGLRQEGVVKLEDAAMPGVGVKDDFGAGNTGFSAGCVVW